MADIGTESDLNKRTAPEGAEFVPPPGKLATPNEIAGFWGARGNWNEQQQSKFVADQATLARRDPEESKHQRALHTDRMRTEVRQDLAKDMTAEEVAEKYKAAGSHVMAEQFERNYKMHLASEDPQKIEAFRTSEADKALKLDERVKANAYLGTQIDSQKQGPATDQAEKLEAAPAQKTPAKELHFFGDKARNYDVLKEEQADALAKSDQDKAPGKTEGKTLNFHEDKNPDNDITR